MPGIIKVSPSKVDEFRTCPRKYNLHYNAKIEEPEAEKTSLQWLGSDERGTMIHRGLELYTKKCIIPCGEKLGTCEVPPGSAEEERIIAALDMTAYSEEDFRNAWEQAVKDTEERMQRKNSGAVVIPLTAKEKELAEAEEVCRNAVRYMIDQMKINHQYPVMAEKSFGLNPEDKEDTLPEVLIEDPGKEAYALNGCIDRVDFDVLSRKYLVIDYKSGNIENKRKLRMQGRDDLIQDRIYALAFEMIYPDKEVEGSKYIFPTENNQEIRESMTRASKDAFRRRLRELIDGMLEKNDESCRDHQDRYPDHEDTCKYCRYTELCTAYSKLEAAAE